MKIDFLYDSQKSDFTVYPPNGVPNISKNIVYPLDFFQKTSILLPEHKKKKVAATLKARQVSLNATEDRAPNLVHITLSIYMPCFGLNCNLINKPNVNQF